MAFSENQVRQLYVATASGAVKPGVALGTIKAKSDKAKETLWLEYMGAGGITSTDKIKISNIVSAKSIKGDKIEIPLNKFKVELKDEVVAGQDYLLRVLFRQYVGMSDEDTYLKYGMVHGVKTMKKNEFYKVLVNSLLMNAMRDEMQLFKVYVHSNAKGASNSNTTTGTAFASGIMEVTKPIKNYDKEVESNPYYVSSSTLVDDIDYIVLEEVEQPWVRGKISASKIPFEVYCDTIRIDHDDILWGTVTEEAPAHKIKSGKLIADLEFFLMGKRGDIYRGIGYPNNIETKYQVNPDKGYDTLDITYFYAGDNEDVQKSQKTITIVADNHTTNQTIKAIIDDINSATGNKPFAIAHPE